MPDKMVHHYRDMEMYCVMKELIKNQKDSLYRNILSKIENTEMLDTLNVYFEANQNIEETAARMYAHKNTIKYRLQRIKDLTGMDIKNFNDSFKLFIAITAYKPENKENSQDDSI